MGPSKSNSQVVRVEKRDRNMKVTVAMRMVGGGTFKDGIRVREEDH